MFSEAVSQFVIPAKFRNAGRASKSSNGLGTVVFFDFKSHPIKWDSCGMTFFENDDTVSLRADFLFFHNTK